MILWISELSLYITLTEVRNSSIPLCLHKGRRALGATTILEVQGSECRGARWARRWVKRVSHITTIKLCNGFAGKSPLKSHQMPARSMACKAGTSFSFIEAPHTALAPRFSAKEFVISFAGCFFAINHSSLSWTSASVGCEGSVLSAIQMLINRERAGAFAMGSEALSFLLYLCDLAGCSYPRFHLFDSAVSI